MPIVMNTGTRYGDLLVLLLVVDLYRMNTSTPILLPRVKYLWVEILITLLHVVQDQVTNR